MSLCSTLQKSYFDLQKDIVEVKGLFSNQNH